LKISKRLLSHPNKRYIDHITRVSNSFKRDINHQLVSKFHDIGKLSKRFQRYISLKPLESEDYKEFEKRRAKLKTTHTLESAYLYFCNTSPQNRDINFLANLFAILKHHSSLPNIKDEINDRLSIIDNTLTEDKLEQIREIATTIDIKFIEDIYEFIFYFEDLSEENSYEETKNFFLFKKRYSRLILADKFEAIFNREYRELEHLNEEKLDLYIKNINFYLNSKPKNRFRERIKERVFNNYNKNRDKNIYLIKAPTGAGKTLIALELSLKIAKYKRDKKRVITAIPFTSIIDQTHLIYEKILKDVLKYHYLIKYRDDETEQFSQNVFLSDIWYQPFIVTTFNQLLYAIFSNHNRDNLKLEALRDSVIIIDEIQNIPRTILESIISTLNSLSKIYNIDLIIMSATLPHLYDLVENSSILSENWFFKLKSSRYRLIYKQDINSYERLKEEILKNISNNSILCVVNTIKKAKELYKILNIKDSYLLSTHQTPQHRKAIIRLIKYRLKKEDKVVLISTQLIEAGIDLDFDIGFREFAPLSSIIQMAGRVNREGKRKKISNVVIFDYIENNKAPYSTIDLQEDKIKSLLSSPIEENKLLENIDSYFIDIRYETTRVKLEENIKKLEFKSLFKNFNQNFMPQSPLRVSLFIEQRPNHFREFIKNREEILQKFKNRFEALNRIKNIEKDLEKYSISINQKLIDKLPINLKEQFGRYILPFNSNFYTKRVGFTLDLEIEDELFD